MKVQEPIGALSSTHPRDIPATETIVAEATPPGRGAIKVIRVSGPSSRELVNGCVSSSTGKKWEPRHSFLAYFLGEDQHPVDQVLVTLFVAPASYTGEDLVEISCHGSPAIAVQIMEVLLGAGGRLAEPGEFTLRAFLNGKLDLAQAEAVRDLVHSQTSYQARIARDQLEGRLSKIIRPLKEKLVRVISHMETGLEFVEDPVEPDDRKILIRDLKKVDIKINDLEKSFRVGRLVKEGFVASIVGRPNAGKSSVFNALLRKSRAIVTAIPGTTRDTIDGKIDLDGIPVQLVDTAGIHEAASSVERLGVKRSLEYARSSDLNLFVVDRSREFSPDDERIWSEVRHAPFLLVVNKVDLSPILQIPEEIEATAQGLTEISALKGVGLSGLRKVILDAVVPDSDWDRDRVVVTEMRHKECLQRARKRLRRGIEGYDRGLSEEFPLYDLRGALLELDKITGDTSVEDILGKIFGSFCIGK